MKIVAYRKENMSYRYQVPGKRNSVTKVMIFIELSIFVLRSMHRGQALCLVLVGFSVLIFKSAVDLRSISFLSLFCKALTVILGLYGL